MAGRRGRITSADGLSHPLDVVGAKVNERIQATGKDLGDKVREAAQEAADEILPDVTKGSEEWDLTKDEMEKELRHLSRR